MKKKKYMRLTANLYINDNLIHLLEDESKKGWFLSNITQFNISFKKDTPKHLKYQIDYNHFSQEYEDIKKELGYKAVCSFIDEDVWIYSHDNIDAPDLQTDLTAQLLSILSCFDSQKILKNIIGMIMFLIFFYIHSHSIIPFSLYHYSMAHFLTNTKWYFGLTIEFILSFTYLLRAIIAFIIHRYYKKQLENSSHQNIRHNVLLLKICQYFQSIAELLCILFLLILLPIPIYLIFILYIMIFIAIIIHHFLSSYKHYQKIQTIVLFSLTAIMIYLLQSQSLNIKPIEKQLYYQNHINSNQIYTTQDLFVHSQNIEFSDEYYEKFVKCLNKDIANIIFKEEIIDLDQKYRKENLIQEYQEVEKNNSDDEDVPYLSFEESIQHMQPYPTKLVDQCYYNDRCVVCIKDEYVLSFQIQKEKDSIMEVIKYYFESI